MSIEDQKLVHNILSRPKMFSSDIETLRDLLIFVQGVSCGRRPPHGTEDLSTFGEFLNRKLGKPIKSRWLETLLSAFGDRTSAVDICETVAQLYDEWWRESQ